MMAVQFGRTLLVIHSGKGRVLFDLMLRERDTDFRVGWDSQPWRYHVWSLWEHPENIWHRLGFSFDSRPTVSVFTEPDAWNYSLTTPWLAVAAVPGMGLGLSAARWRRRRVNIAMNICVRCGYDLRATPQRCPECGMECSNGGNQKIEGHNVPN